MRDTLEIWFCAALIVAVFLAVGWAALKVENAHAGIAPVIVGDGGQTLPPCNAAWWGSSTQIGGVTYYCPKYGTHWIPR